MFFNPRLLIFVGLFVFGLIWCYKVIQRLPDDIRELREVNETARRVAIIFIWAVTVVIAILLVFSSIVIIGRLIPVLRDLF